MKLTFYGGARQVTGANYLLEEGSTKILIDCGLHQGSNFCEHHNWEPFPYHPKDIAAVFVTHAHIDHTGRLPTLVRDGFRGPVYSTPPTRDASALLLADSDHILAEEARRFKKPVLFMYEDIQKLMTQWQGILYHETVTIGPFRITLWNAGHIIGSSFVVVEGSGKTMVFSGDLGNSPAPLIGPWETYPGPATYCVIESAYGDRIHENEGERKEILEDVIEETVKKGGTVVVPAFAMERTQELLLEINDLIVHGRIPRVPVFLDSPLAIKLTDIYRKYDNYLTHGVGGRSSPDLEHTFQFPDLHLTLSTEESKAINDVKPPKIIIAGSGMSHGGRIIHHEKRYLSDPKSTLLIVGYQASGSLGRTILDGAETVKILGEDVAVKARVKAIGGYSAHADQAQLITWLSSMHASLERVFVVQGEEAASEALAGKIVDGFAVHTSVPSPGEEVVL